MAPRFDVTTVGEAMLRLSPPTGSRLARATTLDVHLGGAESNVAVALAAMGHPVAWLSRLPDGPLGRRVAWELAAEGVDVGGIAWASEGRLGIYYVEFGTRPRRIEVVYDRAGSAASGMTPAELAWESLLDSRMIHLTGITPALSDSCRATIHEIFRRAQAGAVPVSFDVNYRARLWPAPVAAETLLPLARQAQLLFCNRADASALFGINGSPDAVLEALHRLFGCPRIVLSLGAEGALARDADGSIYVQPAIPVEPIVDRIGAGDAFAAGVLAGVLEGSLAVGLRYGAAISAIKLSLRGDLARTTRDEVLRVVESAGAEERPAR